MDASLRGRGSGGCGSSSATASSAGEGTTASGSVSRQEELAAEWGECKFGRCETCFYSLRPHLYKSGRQQGHLRLVCSKFFSRDSVTGKPLCWFNMPVPSQLWDQIPLWMRSQHSKLPAALRRNGC